MKKRNLSCVLLVAVFVLYGGIVTARAQVPGDMSFANRRQAQSSLSEEERRSLEVGEISDARHYGGGVTGTVLGFGTGHAIQGRWRLDGMFFTVTEAVSAGVIAVGLTMYMRQMFDTVNVEGTRNFTGNPVLLAGLAGTLFFRLWETIDIWVGASTHNARYKYLRSIKVKDGASLQPAISVTPSGGFTGVQVGF